MMKPKAICVDVSHLLKEIWIRADDTDVLTLNIESPVFILAIIQALFEDVFCLVVKNKIPLNEKHIPLIKDLYLDFTKCVQFNFMSSFSPIVSVHLSGTNVLVEEEIDQCIQLNLVR